MTTVHPAIDGATGALVPHDEQQQQHQQQSYDPLYDGPHPPPTEEELAAMQAVDEAVRANALEIRQLEYELSKLESENRTAGQERALLTEVRAVDALIKRKHDGTAAARPEGKTAMKLSQENLDRILALENAMKLETKRTQELQAAAARVAASRDTIEAEVARIDAELTAAEEATGRSRTSATEHAPLLENVTGAAKARLAALDVEQRTTYVTTTKLTQHIEALGRELEAYSEVERLAEEARNILAAKSLEHEQLVEEVGRQHRTAAKKERQITHTNPERFAAEFKALEADKRAAHAELLRHHEAVRVASRAVEANAEVIGRVERSLDEVAGLLAAAFRSTSAATTTGDEGALVPAERRAVPVAEFDVARREMDALRAALATKDQTLEDLDVAIEALERKVQILGSTCLSRRLTELLEYRGSHRRRDELRACMERSDRIFTTERQRLLQENEMLAVAPAGPSRSPSKAIADGTPHQQQAAMGYQGY